MQDDKEKISYLQKIAGLSLTGNTETCFILYGSTTRNGKSTFCETLIHLLGDYAVTMKPESLAVRQNLDSRTASGDIARSAGCRLYRKEGLNGQSRGRNQQTAFALNLLWGLLRSRGYFVLDLCGFAGIEMTR